MIIPGVQKLGAAAARPLKGDDTMPDHRNTVKDIAARKKPENEREASTLLPMLVAGLVLIIVGSIVVMTFV